MTRAQKVRRGRPPKLDDALAAEIASRLIVGQTTTEVAQTLGISRRSIAGWRARAWSTRPEDRVCVELEQMIWRGRATAAEAGQERRLQLQPLDQLFTEIDQAFDC